MFARYLILFCLLAMGNSLSEVDQELKGRIMGGTIANHPAVASVRSSMAQGNLHICGAFILSSRWVCTAAQCVHDRTTANTIVGVGTNNITPTIRHNLDRIVWHPSFNVESIVNDIALLQTQNEIIFGTTTASISIDFNPIVTNVDVTIFGWGRATETGNLQTPLRSAIFRVVPLAQCRDSFPVPMRPSILDSHLCTQWTHRATCVGDSGGPIVLRHAVIGIISWVKPCTGGQTNVNTRLSSYAEWIVGIIFGPETTVPPTTVPPTTIPQTDPPILTDPPGLTDSPML